MVCSKEACARTRLTVYRPYASSLCRRRASKSKPPLDLCDYELTLSQAESELADIKSKSKQIFRKLNRNSEPQASIESGPYTLQCAHPQDKIPTRVDSQQLSDQRRYMLPLHLRAILPSQARIHIPLRYRWRVHQQLHSITSPSS